MSFNSLLPLAINRARFLKPKEKSLISEVIDSPEAFRALSSSDVEKIIGRRLQTEGWEPENFLAGAERDQRFCERRGCMWVTYWDSSYPPLLREIYDAPYLLYWRGEMPPAERPAIGIVGTRKPTGKAKIAAYRLGLDAGRERITVVSGLASGIDGAAHKGCVVTEGPTVAVLGCGIDRVYPAEHKKLAAEILENGGALLSEYPPGIPPLRYNFPARNRIISGLSRGVVIVQCPEKSGALITGEYALDQGRDLYVHADGLSGCAGAGTWKLEQDGATVIHSLEEIAADWNIDIQHRGQKKTRGERMNTDVHLAVTLEQELNSTISQQYGEYFWRG
jgi:DNA processing protein